MANSKLIVVEGAQGCGKTTITDFLRYSVPYTNLYRLCGTADKTITGLNKSIKMYDNLLEYMKGLENTSINLVFDRTFFTEEAYCRLGYKDYSFTEEYDKLVYRFSKLDFEIYYITLYLDDTSVFETRLNRSGKAVVEYAKFDISKSVAQQETYLKMAEEIKEKYPNIIVRNVNTNRENIEDVKKEILDIIK